MKKISYSRFGQKIWENQTNQIKQNGVDDGDDDDGDDGNVYAKDEACIRRVFQRTP